MENNAILSALSARKSVRVFTPDPVTPDERAAILNAAFQAPTAGNQQLYTILDITDPALKATLADLCDHQPFIAGAPLVLVFLADCRRWLNAYHAAGITDARKPGAGDLMLAVADTCIAAQNAVVAAESLGIGSCYIGDVLENAEAMRDALHLPQYVVPACMLVFLLRAYSTRGLLEIDFHPAWLVLNLALVLAEIWCMMNLTHWALPVVGITAVVCVLNIREVLSMLDTLIGKFLKKRKS